MAAGRWRVAIRCSFVKRRRPSIAALVVLVSMLIVATAITGYARAGSHAILPGIRGCELIRSTAPQNRCVRSLLEDAMAGRSTEAGLKRVDRLASEHELVATHCHLAMHPIGEVAGRKAAKAGHVPPPANGSDNCRRGYMHGMMLGYVSNANGGDVAAALPALCARDSQGERNCAHVVGHLIAREAGQAGAEQAIADSCVASTLTRDTAVRLTDARADADECVRGGYMEIALTAKQPPLDTWRKRCEKSPARGRVECFAWLPPIADYRRQSDADAAAQCAKVRGGSSVRDDCVAGVSRLLGPKHACDVFRSPDDRITCGKVRKFT
jgi:hypothetical protein